MKGIIRAAAAVVAFSFASGLYAEDQPDDRRGAAVDLVHQFFEAFDARDLAGIEAPFAPSALIVHYNGVITDVPEFVSIVRDAKSWAPRTRELSEFEVEELGGGNLLLTCRNAMISNPGTPQQAPYAYTETWLLQETGGELRVIHVHYSMITATEHSEG